MPPTPSPQYGIRDARAGKEWKRVILLADARNQKRGCLQETEQNSGTLRGSI